MPHVRDREIADFIERTIPEFHQRRLAKLQELRLADVLRRKNPYLFKAKAIDTAQDLVRSILDAHPFSQEEGTFGDFLEKLAIFICRRGFRGAKSSSDCDGRGAINWERLLRFNSAQADNREGSS